MRSQLSRCAVFVCLLALFVVAIPLHAAVVVVHSDDAMIRTAPAIVTGTAVDVYARLSDRGNIETVTRILVDETVKGNVPAGQILELVQFGGALNGRFEAQSGAPHYEVGARYLVVLGRNGRGDWTTFDLALGQFRFVHRDGAQFLVRDTTDIEGWTTSGEPFHDVDREAAPFLAFAREVVRTASEPRMANLALHAAPLAALDYDLKSVSQSAVPKWHGGASAMNDGVSASAASSDTMDLSDNESRVIANDPHSEITGTFGAGSNVIATAFYGSTGAQSMKNSENYIEIDREDVVVNDGVSSGTLSAEKFLTAIVHEFGHTWGFRHSNQGTGGGFCALPLPCTSSAIMNSSVATGLNGNLQSWDQDAANEVYGDGSRQATFTGSQYVVLLGGLPARRPGNATWRISQNAVTCTAPGITTQPSGSTIAQGNQATLTVLASGSPTLTYQWYQGNPPSTSNPVGGGTTASIQVSPASTTTYWVRVSNSCPGSVDSNAATVTVNATGCPNVVVGAPGAVDLGNGTFQLSVTASGGSGFTYAWFQGSSVGVGSQVGSGNPFTTGVINTQTSFWARVTNSCANNANSSRVVTVGPAPCNSLVIINQPQNQTVLVGGTVQLSVGFIGTTPATVLWYRGAPPDTSNLVGSNQTITSPVINATTTFYAKITNACSTVTSNVVTVTATQTCNPPAINSASATPSTAQPGTPVTLAVDASGSSLVYQWFRGASGDTSNPITGATASTFTETPPAAGTFLYWVRVSSGCGTAAPVNSNTITVTITSQCVPPTIVQPSNVDVVYGEKATLTVTPLAGSEPLHYAWFQGAKFDTSHPVGTDSPTLVTPSALTQDTQFFVNVSNACGNLNSETINVKVNLPRRHAAKSK